MQIKLSCSSDGATLGCIVYWETFVLKQFSSLALATKFYINIYYTGRVINHNNCEILNIFSTKYSQPTYSMIVFNSSGYWAYQVND